MKLYNRKPNNEIQWLIILFTVLEITSRINSDRGYWMILISIFVGSSDHRLKTSTNLQLSEIKGTTNGLDYNWLVYSGIPPTLGPPVEMSAIPQLVFCWRPKSARKRSEATWEAPLRDVGKLSDLRIWHELGINMTQNRWSKRSNPKHDQDLFWHTRFGWFFSKVSSSHPSSPVRCDCFLMASWGGVWVVESPFILGTLWYSNMASRSLVSRDPGGARRTRILQNGPDEEEQERVIHQQILMPKKNEFRQQL